MRCQASLSESIASNTFLCHRIKRFCVGREARKGVRRELTGAPSTRARPRPPSSRSRVRPSARDHVSRRSPNPIDARCFGRVIQKIWQRCFRSCTAREQTRRGRRRLDFQPRLVIARAGEKWGNGLSHFRAPIQARRAAAEGRAASLIGQMLGTTTALSTKYLILQASCARFPPCVSSNATTVAPRPGV